MSDFVDFDTRMEMLEIMDAELLPRGPIQQSWRRWYVENALWLAHNERRDPFQLTTVESLLLALLQPPRDPQRHLIVASGAEHVRECVEAASAESEVS